MKTSTRNFLLMLAFGLIFSASQAQTFRYGVSGGFNFARLMTRQSIDTTRFKSFGSPRLGINFGWRFHAAWSLQTGLFYSHNGGIKSIVSDTLIQRERYSYHYVQIPFSLQYCYKEFLFLRFGTYMGALTDAFLTRSQGPPGRRGRILNPTRQRTRYDDLRNSFFPLDIGLTWSAGMQFSTGFNLEFSYMRSLKPVRRADHLYNSVFSVSLNYIINYAEKGNNFFEPRSRHIFYLEMGGAAFGGSANYEYVFYQHPNIRLAGRVGLGITPFRKALSGSIPMGIIGIVGQQNHHFELGFIHCTMLDAKGPTFLAVGHSGYRFQKPTGGLFFRLSYTPYIANYHPRNYEHWGAISIGWALKSKKAQ